MPNAAAINLSDRAALAMAAVVAIAGFILLRTYDPNAADSLFPPCIFRAATGFFCAGCGITRAMHALAHGDLAQAFAMNPLAVLLVPVVPMILLHARGWRPQRLAPLMSVLTSGTFWIVLIPAYWIARNLPWWPFTLLAPG